MKKRIFMYTVMILFIFTLVACSDKDDEKDSSSNDDETTNDEEVEEDSLAVEKEVLFTYEHEESGEYGIQSIQTDVEGKAVTFTGLESIDRKDEYFTYVVDHNDEVFEGLELADDENQDRRCTDMSFSPNGNYLIYNCHDDDVEFSVYDMEKEDTIYQVPEFDVYSIDIIGISNDLIVYYTTENDDYQVELSLYDIEKESSTDYIVEDILDVDEDYLEVQTVLPTEDGKQLLINTYTQMYLFDTETEEVEEIANVESQEDEYDTDIFIYNMLMSPNGQYAYYHIREADTDAVYSEYFFQNLETGDVTAFGDLDYQGVSDIDNNGNVLLRGSEELYLYNIDDEEVRLIPEIEVSTYSGYFTLTGNGEYLFYTDKERMEDETYEQYLYRVSLGDVDAYELTDLQAKEEQVQEDVGQDSIAISENEFDEKDMLVDLWEDSISVMYPTEFPEKVLHKTNHHSGEPSNRRFTQTIFLEPESYGDDKVGFTVSEQDGDRTCTAFDDLDVVDTIDGDEYLFYDYKNKDVEAAVAIDGYCYYFDAEEKTEEEMLAIAQSLEPIDSVFHEISVDDLKFPTKFTIEEPEVSDPRVISYTDGEKVDFLIDYRGDLDKDIKMDFEIRNNEPSGYMSESSGQEVEVDGWEEAYFNESSTRLFLYDGDYYYIVKFDLSTDQQEVFGMDHIIETAIEIGESIQ